MALLGGIIDVYIISTATGSIYLAFGALMGQLGAGTHSGGHAGAGHGHIGPDGHAGPSIGHGHAAPGGHAGPSIGHGHAAPGGHAGPSISHGHAAPGHASGDSTSHEYSNSALPGATTQTSLVHAHPNARGLVALLLTVLSPMTLSIFFAFFGITGLLALKIMPFMGLMSLIPAVFVGLIVTQLSLQLLSWMASQGTVSTEGRVEELIGQQARVNTAIRAGRTGEIICEMGSKRYNYPAKALEPDRHFETGSKVIISDIRNNILYVEPWTDVWLESDDINEKQKLPD